MIAEDRSRLEITRLRPQVVNRSMTIGAASRLRTIAGRGPLKCESILISGKATGKITGRLRPRPQMISGLVIIGAISKFSKTFAGDLMSARISNKMIAGRMNRNIAEELR